MNAAPGPQPQSMGSNRSRAPTYTSERDFATWWPGNQQARQQPGNHQPRQQPGNQQARQQPSFVPRSVLEVHLRSQAAGVDVSSATSAAFIEARLLNNNFTGNARTSKANKNHQAIHDENELSKNLGSRLTLLPYSLLHF